MSKRHSVEMRRPLRRVFMFAIPMLALTGLAQAATGWSFAAAGERVAATGWGFASQLHAIAPNP
jgi:hypothetical protein